MFRRAAKESKLFSRPRVPSYQASGVEDSDIISLDRNPRDGEILSGQQSSLACMSSSTLACTMKLDVPRALAWQVAVDWNDMRVLRGCADYQLRLWSLSEGRECAALQGHSASPHVVSASWTSGAVLSAGADAAIRHWDLNESVGISTMVGHKAPVMSLATDWNESFAATGSLDRSIICWDLRSSKMALQLDGHSSAVWSVSLDFDAKTAWSGSADGSLRRWELRMGQHVGPGFLHESTVTRVAHHPQQELVMTASSDGMLRLWDVADRSSQEVGRHGGAVWAFDVDWRECSILSASAAGTILRHDWGLPRVAQQRPQSVQCFGSGSASGQERPAAIPAEALGLKTASESWSSAIVLPEGGTSKLQDMYWVQSNAYTLEQQSDLEHLNVHAGSANMQPRLEDCENQQGDSKGAALGAGVPLHVKELRAPAATALEQHGVMEHDDGASTVSEQLLVQHGGTAASLDGNALAVAQADCAAVSSLLAKVLDSKGARVNRHGGLEDAQPKREELRHQQGGSQSVAGDVCFSSHSQEPRAPVGTVLEQHGVMEQHEKASNTLEQMPTPHNEVAASLESDALAVAKADCAAVSALIAKMLDPNKTLALEEQSDDARVNVHRSSTDTQSTLEDCEKQQGGAQRVAPDSDVSLLSQELRAPAAKALEQHGVLERDDKASTVSEQLLVQQRGAAMSLDVDALAVAKADCAAASALIAQVLDPNKTRALEQQSDGTNLRDGSENIARDADPHFAPAKDPEKHPSKIRRAHSANTSDPSLVETHGRVSQRVKDFEALSAPQKIDKASAVPEQIPIKHSGAAATPVKLSSDGSAVARMDTEEKSESHSK